MRLVKSAPMERPIVWSVTKIENTKPLGIQKLTIYQNFWNDHTDYVEHDENGNIIGMYANYFDSEILPEDTSHLTEDIPYKSTKIEASSSNIKIGGSYKTLSAKLYSEDNEDISELYKDLTFSWTCSIDEIDFSNKVTWLSTPDFNKIKIKFPNDKSVLGKILKIKCTLDNGISIAGDFNLAI